ncbi:MAG TPA: sugar phosphate nucleotidyltransferase [Bacteroidia bacterium]|nr:sugar phosphate nucleotidyltransferase [Bacteroidia bacterium]HRS57600.1 sugar phosphate nucleotidyltransferase [Bacteroidia bacterium]HRU67186.1 sugar phosphate nucleotidyltransferase [Bacteroidia bacterium]
MKIIIPMAGLGKRMRPHTLTTPKPLLDIAGKSIVSRLITDISEMLSEPIEEVAYIIGDFGKQVEEDLYKLSEELNLKAKIYYQYEALGTAHALYMAKDSLSGNVLVAYADTLFYTTFKADISEDACIWVKKIDNPSQFGVVELDHQGYITRFVEKPKEFVSDLAIIGIYYFKDASALLREIEFLLENNITGNGEYQLTDALERLMNKGMKIKAAEVQGWFDCGNKNAVLQTHQEIFKLGKFQKTNLLPENITGSVIHQPCYIAEDVKIIDSEIGPYVSIGNGTIVENAKIENSIIYSHASIQNATLRNSMIGSYVKYHNMKDREVSLGDYSEIL